MAIMPIADSMFLLGESREHPMHVGGLALFGLPDGAGPDDVGKMYHQMLAYDEVAPLFRRQPADPVSSLGQLMWSDDNQLDMEYHVRHSALPSPGRVRELLELTSRLHGSLLDRHRPLWEFHVIEGLERNRFATYTKIHHALLDGVSALRLMQSALSLDPDERDMPPPWAPRPVRPRRGRTASPLGTMTSAVRAVSELVGLGPAVVKAANELLREQAALVPSQAPKSMLNVPITGARRFAAQGWPLERVKTVGREAGASLNDVMLAMCGGALRRYLLEFDALPDRPLVAAVPVSLRGKTGVSDGGNAIGLILCSLATDLDDDGVRLERISTSMKRGKRLYAGLSALQITALSAIPLAALVFAPIPGFLNVAPPPFNILIS